MKFKINPTDVDYMQLKEKLSQNFPNYSFDMRGSNILVAKKSNILGANILIRKKDMLVVGNFPTMTATMIFTLIFILLGIVIPLILYFIFLHSKMKTVENEIGSFLKREYEL